MIEIPKNPEALAEMQALWTYQFGELVALKVASCGEACKDLASAGSAALPLGALAIVTPLVFVFSRRLRLASQTVEQAPQVKPGAFLAAVSQSVRSALSWLKSNLRVVFQRAQ
jgi:hypothetical protein